VHRAILELSALDGANNAALHDCEGSVDSRPEVLVTRFCQLLAKTPSDLDGTTLVDATFGAIQVVKPYDHRGNPGTEPTQCDGGPVAHLFVEFLVADRSSDTQ